MENDAFGMDLLVLNHKKFPDKFLIWKHKVIWKPKELFKTGGIFLKILEILLKTGGIFKNRWNQKPVEFFLSKKTVELFHRFHRFPVEVNDFPVPVVKMTHCP